MGDFQPIIDAIGLTDNPVWDIFLYVLFFLNLLMLILLPDGASLHTLLIIFVLISLFIDKTYAFGHLTNSSKYSPEDCHAKIFFGTYLVRAVIFVAPLIIAGSTENGKVRGMGILLGLFSGGYLLARWFVDQRDVSTPEVTCMSTGVVAQNAGMFITLAYATVHRSLRAFTVDREVPVTVLGELAAHEIEV